MKKRCQAARHTTRATATTPSAAISCRFNWTMKVPCSTSRNGPITRVTTPIGYVHLGGRLWELDLHTAKFIINLFIYWFSSNQMNKGMNERMNERMHGWMGGWMNGWMDEWMDRCINHPYPSLVSIFWISSQSCGLSFSSVPSIPSRSPGHLAKWRDWWGLATPSMVEKDVRFWDLFIFWTKKRGFHRWLY